MNRDILIGLLNNAALLLALGVLYDTVPLRVNLRMGGRRSLAGLGIGAAGIAIMLNPWHFGSGVVFDTRSILLSLSGLFFGPIPTLVAAAMTSAFRLYQGGAGAWVGTAVILTSSGLGIAWGWKRRWRRTPIGAAELYLFGLAVHVAMLLWMLSLPASMGPTVLRTIALPVMLIYPLATVLLGLLLAQQFARREMAERLKTLNRFYAVLSHANQAIVRIREPEALFAEVCRIAVQESGLSLAWVIAVDADGDRAHNVAHAESDGLYDESVGKGLAAVAQREGRRVVMNDIARDERAAPWREAALQRGILSAVAFPLAISDAIRAVFCLGAREPGFFDAEEIGLLDELAMDLAYALEFAERDRERRRAQEELQQTLDTLQSLYVEMEQRVAQRTAQLQAANQELEAFAYSVSHDLRAPLRAIDGFARILVEEYASRLDEEGRRLLSIVCANVQRMEQLIAAMLALSRVTRAELSFSRVDMTAMARSIYAEVSTPEERARVELRVSPLPEAYGDPHLLRQVWANLLANAIKYSRPKEVPRIEVGGYVQEGMAVYCVRDNGVGFDPTYAHKLFDPFQRLHSAEEFEGLGVGLAIVRRIVQRHGGRAWAEGAPGQGARFYFALPRESGDAST
ncbi:MAG: GAF domain-containing protein [Chloroflexi bacterium]|nr:GAF domain-containing protein [Chloroflexota bacterium]